MINYNRTIRANIFATFAILDFVAVIIHLNRFLWSRAGQIARQFRRFATLVFPAATYLPPVFNFDWDWDAIYVFPPFSTYIKQNEAWNYWGIYSAAKDKIHNYAAWPTRRAQDRYFPTGFSQSALIVSIEVVGKIGRNEIVRATA